MEARKINPQVVLGSMFEIEPLDQDKFLKVRETLTRIGISSKKPDDLKPTLWQSCHVLHRRSRYYLCHFKQLFQLDGRADANEMTEDDYCRLEHIVALLTDWGLIKPLDQGIEKFFVQKLTIVPFKEKSEWILKPKYLIGVKDASKSKTK